MYIHDGGDGDGGEALPVEPIIDGESPMNIDGDSTSPLPSIMGGGIMEGDALGPLLWAIFFSPCAEEIARVARMEGWTELSDLWDSATPLDSSEWLHDWGPVT